jgi:hypothetical protein
MSEGITAGPDQDGRWNLEAGASSCHPGTYQICADLSAPGMTPLTTQRVLAVEPAACMESVSSPTAESQGFSGSGRKFVVPK